MTARIKLWWHCLWRLFHTLWTQNPKVHREITVTFGPCIAGTRVQIPYRYAFIGCTCGKVYHKDWDFEIVFPEEAAKVKEWTDK